MPFKSLSQERWGHSPAGVKALGGPAKVAEWDAATKGMKLPAKAAKAPLTQNQAVAAIRKKGPRM